MEKDFANPQHPLNGFPTGNKETLETLPSAAGVDVRAALLAFHRQHYSARLMTLAVIGRESLHALEAAVTDLFSAVPDRAVENPAL